MLNRDPELTFGAQIMDMADQTEEVEFALRDTQVIIGVYGVKIRHENDVILRFSFILNNDFWTDMPMKMKKKECQKIRNQTLLNSSLTSFNENL